LQLSSIPANDVIFYIGPERGEEGKEGRKKEAYFGCSTIIFNRAASKAT